MLVFVKIWFIISAEQSTIVMDTNNDKDAGLEGKTGTGARNAPVY